MSGRHIEDILAEAIYILMPTSSEVTQHGLLKAMIPALDRHSIRADEVEAVIGTIIADGVRPSQLTTEVMKRVQAKRAIKYIPASRASSIAWQIDQESQRRRGDARTKEEVEDAFHWERNRRIENGLHVEPLQPPLTRKELDEMQPEARSLGLKYGFLKRVDGRLEEVIQ